MEGMTIDDKLLAQDDIDVLLGEAGLDGGYDVEEESKQTPKAPVAQPVVRFSNVTDDAVRDTVSLLLSKAILERDDNVKVIWNAIGTIPMASGFNMSIQDTDFVSLGVLKGHHLVVKQVHSE